MSIDAAAVALARPPKEQRGKPLATPAARIIRDLGGAAKVAAILGLNRATVHKWRQPKAKGGTGGLIPQSHWLALIEAAAAQRWLLSPADFLPRAGERTFP